MSQSLLCTNRECQYKRHFTIIRTVALLDGSPLLLERLIIHMLEQFLEQVQILEPFVFRTDGVRNKLAKTGIALIEPSTGSD